MVTIAQFCDEMAALDRVLRSHTLPRSLSPAKDEMTSFGALAACLEHAVASGQYSASRQGFSATLAAAGSGLSEIVHAMITHFPDTIFWDMDYLMAALVGLPTAADITLTSAKIADLMQRFGIHSPIRFQYAHDFTYGFDWARWVAKDPRARAEVQPYGLEFLTYLENREAELLELIRKNDHKYHQLPDGRTRNPFAFNRTPAAERSLHEALADRGLVPVAAWAWGGPCRWDQDFTRAREDLSDELAKAGA